MHKFAYDALGRRIRKIDSAASETTLYYYNYNWQVLAEYDGSNNLQRKFIYGNGTESPQWRIDEVLLMKADGNDYYYAHDHLYSPAALINSSGTVLERYEYDAYGNCSILEPNFAPDPDGKSDYGNPYLFTGRRLDILDNSSLKIQYNRNRYYDYYTGRWLTHDPLGYAETMNLYEYVASNPLILADPIGLGRTDPELDLDALIALFKKLKEKYPPKETACSITAVDLKVNKVLDAWATGFCPPFTDQMVGILKLLGLVDDMIDDHFPHVFNNLECKEGCICKMDSWDINVSVHNIYIPNFGLTLYWGIGISPPGFKLEPDASHFWACTFHADLHFDFAMAHKSGHCCHIKELLEDWLEDEFWLKQMPAW